MLLAFNARSSTKNVDAIFEPSAEVRAAASVVLEKLGLPADWLNDAAKGFLPSRILPRSIYFVEEILQEMS